MVVAKEASREVGSDGTKCVGLGINKPFLPKLKLWSGNTMDGQQSYSIRVENSAYQEAGS